MSNRTTQTSQEIKVTAAKGRPMLQWVGKRPLTSIVSRPAQHSETFDPTSELSRSPANPDLWRDWPQSYPRGGLLFYGDNKEVLAHLIANGFRGKVKLIYIDPPFDSGADYVRKVQLRGSSSSNKLDGEGQTLLEQVQYNDIWANDNYLQFMYERLLLLKELLAEDGCIYLHCDWHKSHLLRLIMDEIFGPENCRNEIVWIYHRFGLGNQNHYTRAHDTILWYVKSPQTTFNLDAVRVPYSEKTIANFEGGLGGSGFGQGELNPLGKIPEDFWDIAPAYKSLKEVLPFPTQKPEALLRKVIMGSSSPGDIVLDCFIGSGTTAAVAQKLGRRWIGCDINKGAIQTTSKRLQTIIQKQIEQAAQPQQRRIDANEKDDARAPAQLAFTIHRVNNYDLAIQHNEFAALVCEAIGVQRTTTDMFFDGTLGNKLVKIVPFDHPLSPLDLEAVKRELEARGGEEQRSVVMVCLGQQYDAAIWLDNWNKYRAVAKLNDQHQPIEFVNKIEVIDLRTDEKYGEFIVHEPASAEIDISRSNGQINVHIEDFISPTIVKRLRMDATLFYAHITDWRAMVNNVEIDTNYDGTVFKIVHSDIPERKTDLVTGEYSLPASDGPTTVAVKITDMLGEEVVLTKKV